MSAKKKVDIKKFFQFIKKFYKRYDLVPSIELLAYYHNVKVQSIYHYLDELEKLKKIERIKKTKRFIDYKITN